MLATTPALAVVSTFGNSAEAAPVNRLGQLEALIRNHTADHKAFIAAIDAEQAAEETHFETHPKTIIVKLSDGNGIEFHVNYNWQQYVDHTKEEISLHYASKRRVVQRELTGDQAAAEAALASLRASENLTRPPFAKWLPPKCASAGRAAFRGQSMLVTLPARPSQRPPSHCFRSCA
ncbi:hypothetical protein [Mesorhizobium sp. CN2-181]|uniref:hypothetical protein n=1 Tax=Mesorhizobium yinganensis TaxID=3157707 RepID=UPI0032B7B639